MICDPINTEISNVHVLFNVSISMLVDQTWITHLWYYLGNRCNKFRDQLPHIAQNGHCNCNQILRSYQFDDCSVLFWRIRSLLNIDMSLVRFTSLKKSHPSIIKTPAIWVWFLPYETTQFRIRGCVWKWSGYKVKRSWFPFIFGVSIWAILTIVTNGIVLTWTFDISLT